MIHVGLAAGFTRLPERMEGSGDVWHECQLLKRHGQTSCVIRMSGTGAVVLIGLQEPLEIGRAALVSAIHPAPARVCMKDGFLSDCKIEVDWPQTSGFGLPPPIRFQRRSQSQHRNPIQRAKRRRIGG